MAAKILLVCSGNTCRSVMAQGILQAMAEAEGLEGELEVLSAGIAALNGGKATHEALRVLAERGINMSSHISRPLTSALVEEAGLILTMTGKHREEISKKYPAAAAKVSTIKSFAGEDGDIDDPIGLPLAHYRETAATLERLLKQCFKKIEASIKGEGGY